MRRFALLGTASCGLMLAASLQVAAQTATPEAGTAAVLPEIGIEGTAWRSWDHVDGYVAPQTTTGSKVDVPLIEAPQSVGVVTRDQMDDQGAQSVASALRYTAGVLSEVRPSPRYDSVFVRGFGGGGTDAAYVSFLDGLRMGRGANYAVPTVEPWLLERIEVLRGPASVLYGQTGAGGIVNLVSRRPSASQINEVRLEAGSYNRRQAAFDLGGAANENGTLLFRLTGIVRKADSQYDHVGEERIAIAPAITWKPDNDTTLTVLGNYQEDPDAGFYNFVPAAGTVTSPRGRLGSNTFVGDPNFQKEMRRQFGIGYQLEHRLNDIFTLRQNFRYQHLDSERNIVTLNGKPNGDIYPRRALYAKEQVDTYALDNQIQADVHTGALRHLMLAGLDWTHSWAKPKLATGPAPSLNIYDPVYGVTITRPALTRADTSYQQTDQLGVYAQDLISYGRWRFNIGLRQDWASSETTTFSDTGASSSADQDDSATTWRVGALYLFDNGIAPYASYSTSFLPNAGTQAPARGGGTFAPTEGEQFEAGIKYQPPGMNSFIQASVFQITQSNVLTRDDKYLGFRRAAGEIRSRGFEFEAHAALTDHFNLIASYAYTQAEFTRSREFVSGSTTETIQGNRVPQVPEHMASLWGNYSFSDGPLRGLSIGAGVRYIGETYGDNSNSFKVPEYVLFDADLKYDLGAVLPNAEGLSVSVTGSNLGDREYVASCSSATNCYFGLRRMVLGSVSYRW
ncbi:TonB-dependent siderophore receptor [Acetobacteraceae bacterium H6797]|nr:TonB-dependent siderophore receptor [Acetobacteraceae bacterium H6797]